MHTATNAAISLLGIHMLAHMLNDHQGTTINGIPCRTWTFHVQPPCDFYKLSSVAQSCPTLCDPMDCSTPGLPVHHQLLEFMQTHVDRVGDAIQPSHPLLSPSPPAVKLSQHQGLLQQYFSLNLVRRRVSPPWPLKNKLVNKWSGLQLGNTTFPAWSRTGQP